MRQRLFGFMGLPRVDPVSTGATFSRPTRRVTICPQLSYRLSWAVAPARAAGGRPADHGERVPTGFPVAARPTPARTPSPYWRSWCPWRQSARPASPGASDGEAVGARDGSGLARSGTGRPSCPRRRGPASRSPSSLGGRSPPSRSPGGRSLRWRRPARRHGLPRALRALGPRPARALRRALALDSVSAPGCAGRRSSSQRPAADGCSGPPPALPPPPKGAPLFSSRFRALVMFPVQQGAWGIPAGLLACRWPGPQQQAAYVEPQAQQRAKQLEQFLTVNHTVNSTRFTRRETRKRPSRGP